MATQHDSDLLRLLNPVAKLYTAKLVKTRHCCSQFQSRKSFPCVIHVPCKVMRVLLQAMKTASEGLESFGGFGYLEDTDLPRLMRDAQVRNSSFPSYEEFSSQPEHHSVTSCASFRCYPFGKARRTF